MASLIPFLIAAMHLFRPVRVARPGGDATTSIKHEAHIPLLGGGKDVGSRKEQDYGYHA